MTARFISCRRVCAFEREVRITLGLKEHKRDVEVGSHHVYLGKEKVMVREEYDFSLFMKCSESIDHTYRSWLKLK